MERWLRLFPDDFIEQQPHLLLVRAFNHGLRWELGQVRRAIEQLDRLLENWTPASDADRAVLRGPLATLKGHDAFNQGRLPEAVAHCREALALMPEEWVYLRGVAGMYLGLSLHAGGQPVEAERFLTTYYEAARNKSDIYALRLLQALALNALQAGLLATAHRNAQVMLRQSEEGGLALIQGWAHYILGYVHLQWNELEAAREHFESTADLRYTTQLLVARNALIDLSLIHQAMGNGPEAFSTLDVLSRFDIEMYGQEATATAAARARLLLRQGDLAGADQWSEAISLPPAEQLLMPWTDGPLLTRIAVLIARKTPADIALALESLDVMQAIAQRTHSARSLVELLALRALALMECGKPVEARQDLIRSVELSRRSGQIRPYVDLGPPMQRLLGQIAGHRTVTTVVETILAAFAPGGSQTRLPAGPQLEERLTPRELEVIALMSEPISLAEIADRLVISRATAHRHTINVYQKLGVHGRWEAVARATELGILSASL
jgi:LuxR family maltose regulon positive regulatory protein